MKNNEIKLSIKNLIEFVLRSGDLDSRFVGPGRILEGTRSHQKVQKAAGEGYAAEVQLVFKLEYCGFTIIFEGRADGIIKEDEKTIIDEIKTTTRPLEYIDEDYNPLHWAQAKCYAYIYAAQNDLKVVDVRLTYFQLDTQDKKYLVKSYKIAELKEFFFSLLDKYMTWANLTLNWTADRDASIKGIRFPFEAYRKGQRELAVAVYKTIAEQKNLFVQAPTGIGKTISTLFPAVKAMGEGLSSKVFYLTAKTITRQVAEEAFLHMRDLGLKFKTITLTAKDKTCLNKGVGCTADSCEYAKGHFDRVNAALIDILSHHDNLCREVVEEYSRKHKVCPFEYSLDIALWVDCVICDYNYVFDPRVYLKRFFLSSRNDYVFLIDEAHNLVDRAREMFSAELCKTSFLELKRILKEKGPAVSKALGKVNTCMVDLRKKCLEKGHIILEQQPNEMNKLVRNFVKQAEEWLAQHQGTEGFTELLELYFNSLAYLRISEFYDERYVTIVEATGREVRVRLFCVDPAYLLGEAVKRGKSAVLFSATLTPLNYFRDILGGSEDDYIIKLPSPFKQENLCLLTADNISTKYRNREFSYLKIAELVKALVDQKAGNYMVFFPSYKYMNEVVGIFSDLYPETKVLVQESSMPEEDRESFLSKFVSSQTETLIGFGVMGGIFSEGIDLKGDRLIGAVIVGVGLPQISVELDIIMDYFDKRNRMGYEYAYMFPGMNKVLQAAGRVIRSEGDKGVVLLIDDRFVQSGYRKLYPGHWNHGQRVRSAENLLISLKKFWES